MMRIIMAILGVVVAGVVFFEFTEPTYAQIQSDQAQIAQYDAALAKAAQLASVKQSLLSKYNSFSPADIARLQTMLPDQVNDIALILDFDTLAAKDGMTLANVDVSSDGSSVAPQGASGAGIVGADTAPYNTLTMKFSVNGTYANFTQFLTALQASLAIVDIQSIQVTQNSSVSAPGGAVYTFSVSLDTYWLKPSTNATAAAATSTI